MRKTVLARIALASIGIVALLGCSFDRRSDEQIAVDVAREWSVNSVEEVSSAVVDMLGVKVPVVKGQIADGLARDAGDALGGFFR